MNGKVCRNKVVERTVRALRFITERRFGFTILELAQEIGLTKRNAYRYLESFRRVGIHLHSFGGGGGKIKKWKLLTPREHLSKIGII